MSCHHNGFYILEQLAYSADLTATLSQTPSLALAPSSKLAQDCSDTCMCAGELYTVPACVQGASVIHGEWE